MKSSSVFVCQQCGAQSPSFLGRCPNCGEWNTLVEQIDRRGAVFAPGKLNISKPVKLSEIPLTSTNRISTGLPELDMVLGGGIVPGMAVLLSGEPGIGKSTILLEITNKISVKSDAQQSVGSVLYVAGEESASQIKIRADRLKIKSDNLVILETTNVDNVLLEIENCKLKIGLIILDSIQTMTTSDLTGTAGSVGQVRECAARIINTIKPLNIPIFIVGHVTKDGTIAGPKVLEHAVDTILTIEGEKYGNLRLIRTTKNRFGPTDETGIFEMTDTGLITVDPSRALPAEASAKAGSCLSITMEGTRPMLVEIQALVTSTPIPNPRRVASGVNYNRLQTITAIIQKRLNIPLYKEDIYVSTSGGLKIDEPAIDLAIALAIISSYKNKPLPPKTLAIGELDLLGNIRQVNNQDRRLKEARRLGFKNPLYNSILKSLVDFKN